jgi:hypothetical protein
MAADNHIFRKTGSEIFEATAGRIEAHEFPCEIALSEHADSCTRKAVRRPTSQKSIKLICLTGKNGAGSCAL